MRHLTFLFPLILATGAMLGCGGSGDDGRQANGGSGGQPVADAPFASVIEAAGFHATFVSDFASQVPTRKAKVVVYRATSGKDRGGVLYLNNPEGGTDRVVWHWYFDNAAPDSITKVELNNDGLWDVRIHFGKKVEEFTQDVDFTFISRGRGDVIATNGDASHPENVWRAFDGDSITVWKAETGGDRAWVDVATPLGVADGILTVQLSNTDRPGSVRVKVDGKEVKKFDLEMTMKKQLFQLEAAVAGGSTVRLEFEPSNDGTVGISEIGIK